ncbi:MAG: chorismate-binding protein [Reichenbachiella sp.]
MNELGQIKTSNKQVDFTEKLLHFFNANIKIDKPVAIWRTPNSSIIQAICQLDNKKNNIENLENAPQGFIFNPFQESEENKNHFIKADISFDSDQSEIKLNPERTNSSASFEKLLTTIKEINESKFYYSDYLNKSPKVASSKDQFVQLIEKSKKSISDGYYQKIVPSRQEKFKLKKNFHPVKELLKLCNEYENAFVSLVYIPDSGLWLGASPELLISVKEQKIFETISLAGTQEIPENFNLAKATWTQKEIEEQALVSRYIINCFKQIRLREFDEFGPKTVKAGNLMHLKTTFEVDMEDVNFPQLGSVMLDLLHPTSAVCGMPMIPAAKFLKENEHYDRQYFSGYLGPVNIGNQIGVYVNLRCMRIYKDTGVLFAGAGVTEDSDAESEWNETKIKFQTLLNVIGK